MVSAPQCQRGCAFALGLCLDSQEMVTLEGPGSRQISVRVVGVSLQGCRGGRGLHSLETNLTRASQDFLLHRK